MATGDSAFTLCNSTKSIDTMPVSNNSPLLPSQTMSMNPTKSSPISMKWDSPLKKKNLVNSPFSTRSKEDFDRFPILYLYEAKEIIWKGSTSQIGWKNELEEKSLQSVDETNYSSSKRFEFQLSSSTKSNKKSSQVQKAVSSSDLISMDTLWATKAKKFGDRPDVIYKTILRSFKKYYLNDFNEVTDYKKKKRRNLHHDYLIEMTANYVNEKFTNCPYDDLNLFIAALVQQKIPESLENNERLMELSKTVSEVLYRFNKSKMTHLLLYQEFSFLLKKFLSIDNLLEFIGDKSSAPQATQNLEGQIEYLLQQCNVVLSQSNPDTFGEGEDTVFDAPTPRTNNRGKLG